MRHANHNRKFGRENDARRALLRSLAEALFAHGKIVTTSARAKELRPFVERLISIGRKGTLSAGREIVARLGTKKRMKMVALSASDRIKAGKGGYTRIVKLPQRASDASPMSLVELI